MKDQIHAFCSMLLSAGVSVAATIQDGEWFINADPGVGSGTGFSVSGTSASVTVPPTSLETLSSGVHLLGVRLRDSNENWGHTVWRPFLRDEAPAASPSLVAGEWFIGSDPGVGNGNPFAVVSGDISVGISGQQLQELSTGVHLLGVRLRDSDAKWGHTVLRAFLKDEVPETPSGIVGLTYRIVRAGEVFATENVSLDAPALQIERQVVHGKQDLLLGASHELQVIPTDATGRIGHAATVGFSYEPYADAWLKTHFTEAERLDPEISGDDADPDQDGLSNATERAFALNPRDSADAARAVARITRELESFNLGFRVPAGGSVGVDGIYSVSNLQYKVLYGDSPAADNQLPASWLENWSLTPLEGGAGYLEIKINPPPAAARFFRLTDGG